MLNLIYALFISLFLLSCGGSSSGSKEEVSVVPTTPLENEGVNLPDADTSSLSNVKILSLSTDMGDGSVLSTLLPDFTSTISLINLTDSNPTLSLETNSGVANISSFEISQDKRSIEFISPSNVIDGNLTIMASNASASYVYKTQTSLAPRLISITPDTLSSGESASVSGVNLPNGAVELLFEGQGSSFTQSVTPSNNTLNFTLPDGVESGNIYLQGEDFETNRIYLSVKRDVNVRVGLSSGVDIKSSKISFILGLEEFVLDSEYKTTLSVEENSLDYIHAVVENEDNASSVLYSSVVLPTDTQTIEVDSSSTAIAWIFMGMGVSVASEVDNLQNVYAKISSNAKVQAFASYIDELQKNNLSAWSSLSDATLKEKYQEALQDVLQSYNRSVKSAASREDDPNAIIIVQKPLNNQIYVNEYSYDYSTYGAKLRNGAVSIVNDTKLYMSVEIKSKKDGKIVNNYAHVDELMTMNHNSLIGPKGWALLGIASSKELALHGKDSDIEIVIGSAVGTTDKNALSLALSSRVFIDGVATPMINMLVSAFMDRRISDTHSFKNLIDVMTDIYGTNFFIQLTTMVSQEDNSYFAIADTLIYKPIKKGIDSCYQYPVGTACETTLTGLAKLIWNSTDNATQKIMSAIATAAGKRVAKKAAAIIPVGGWVASAAFFVYDNIDTISDGATILESMADMGLNPREINVNVDFPLDVESVNPTCIGITPQSLTQTFTIKGEGFSESNQLFPEVFIYEDDTEVSMSDITILDGSKEMVAAFDAQTLLGNHSWSGNFAVEHLGQIISYDTPIRIISSEDSNLYFDSVEPEILIRGNIATLKGCGWIPLDSVEVEFTTTTGLVKATIVSKSIHTIEVEIPSNAVSGLLYVNTTNKTILKSIEISEFGLSSTSKNELKPGESFALSGSGLIDTAHLYFQDAEGSLVEGGTENITDTGIWVSVPDGLSIGVLKLYVVLSDGTKSNELTLVRVPKSPEASPSTGDIGDGLEVTLSQDEGADIYYTLHDGDKDTAIKYTSPINLNVQDMKYTEEFIYAFARVGVDGVDYDSETETFTYNACGEGMELNAERECKDKAESYMESCPIYDAQKDEAAGDFVYGFSINKKDKDGNGYYEDYVYCSYRNTPGGIKIYEQTPYVDRLINGIALGYYPNTGLLRFSTSYVAGERNGRNSYYYESGQLYWEMFYNSDGYLEGTLKKYFKSGQLSEKRFYMNNASNQERLNYLEDGCLYSKQIYINDILTDEYDYECD